ncbi:MAG: hypothetical protein ACI89L_002793 [Phycisphaerales bacterium]|jgi:hypothetical protein
MAARTGASIGVAIAITVLAVFAFTFFVLTLVFFGRAQDATKGKDNAELAITEYVTEQQRTQTSVQQALREAQAKGPGTTVVSDLIATQREIMERVTGNRDISPTQFFANLDEIEGSEAAPLFGLLTKRSERINSLNAALGDAEAGRQAAIERADAEAKRVSELAEEYEATGSNLIAEVGDYTQQIQATINGYGQVEDRMQDNLENTVTTFENKEREYRGQIAQMTNENLILQDQLRRLRQEGAADRPRPLPEESLADGIIEAINPADREVVLSIGREQKVILGMTFAVYSDATDIRPNALSGNYPAGKATLEVVRVEDGFSRARVITESRGNPIVRGDVVANAVYDPNKTYKFVVYGLFDMNRDGIKSKYESDDVAAMIRTWGGQIVTDLEGDLDFVVLGERPTLPPEPGLSAGPEEFNFFIQMRQEIARYDELREKAISTAVPILNENRLRTLIGDYPN